MGCGQSQFSSLIYPRKSKKKAKKNRGDSDDDDDDDDADGNKSFVGGRLISNKSVSNLVAAAANEEEVTEGSPSVPAIRPTRLNLAETVTTNSSPLVVNREMTSSQKEFFELLDQRILDGPDYEEKCDAGYLLDNVRIKQLLNEWEKARMKHRLTANKGRRVDQSAVILQQQTPMKQRRRIHGALAGFVTPHLNGDVFRAPYHPPYHYSSSTLRQQHQTAMTTDIRTTTTTPNNAMVPIQPYYSTTTPPPQVLTFSNTIIQYDQLKGSFYTELA